MDKYEIAIIKVAACNLGGFGELAIEAIREKQERENPQPLTLEQLQNRDEQPVWVVPTEKSSGNWGAYWGIVSVNNNAILDVWETVLTFDDVGVICQAYDHPPKETAYEH